MQRAESLTTVVLNLFRKYIDIYILIKVFIIYQVFKWDRHIQFFLIGDKDIPAYTANTVVADGLAKRGGYQQP